MNDLIRQLRQFNRERDWEQYHTPKNVVMALMVEVGELVEHFQWLTPEQSMSLEGETQERVREEIGDVVLYLLNLADKLGIDPLEAAREKLVKNAEKYPIPQAKGKAIKYTHLKKT